MLERTAYVTANSQNSILVEASLVQRYDFLNRIVIMRGIGVSDVQYVRAFFLNKPWGVFATGRMRPTR